MTNYEWDVETVTTVESEAHEVGEVLDHNHQPSKAYALAFAAQPADPGTRFAVVLVRDSSTYGRTWAYMNADGTMPERFVDAFGHEASVVPARFRL